jgi:hypothetical protein
MAPATAAGTGAGQFGSLRTQTAADKALTDAQAQLFAQQMTAANQAQQIGAQAAQGVGQLGAQDIAGASTLTGLQQSAPFAASANLAKVIGGLSVPTSETQSAQLSPLSQVGSLVSGLGGGTSAVNSLLNQISPGASISSLLGGLFKSSPGLGQTTDASGNIITDPTYGNPDESSWIKNGIPTGVTVDESGMGSNGQDYSYLLSGI